MKLIECNIIKMGALPWLFEKGIAVYDGGVAGDFGSMGSHWIVTKRSTLYWKIAEERVSGCACVFDVNSCCAWPSLRPKKAGLEVNCYFYATRWVTCKMGSRISLSVDLTIRKILHLIWSSLIVNCR